MIDKPKSASVLVAKPFYPIMQKNFHIHTKVMKEKNMPFNKIGVVVLNYSTYEQTKECVNALLLQKYEEYYICVVDNNSPNDSYKILKDDFGKKSVFGEKLFLVEAEKNGGYSYGNNLGIRKLEKFDINYLFVLNNDVIIDDLNFLTHAIEFMELNPIYSLIGPQILLNGQKTFPLYEKRPTWQHIVMENFLINSIGRKLRKTLGSNSHGLVGVKKVYAISGCCMFWRYEDFKLIGFFDESRFLYGEEIIAAEKLHKHEKLTVFNPELCVNHHHSTTINKFYSKIKIVHMINGSILSYIINFREDIYGISLLIVKLSFTFNDFIKGLNFGLKYIMQRVFGEK